jgi:hypothetical protein
MTINRDPLIAKAKQLMQTGAIPRDAYDAFRQQVRNAKSRGIPFLFEPLDWWEWWQTDNRWLRRGNGSGLYAMGRIGDIGAYEPGNVECVMHNQNSRLNASRGYFAKSRIPNPYAKAVVTPFGRFESLELAAKSLGITRQTIARRAREATDGWAYAGDER